MQGTNVYNTQGDNLGEVYDVMIDKRSGKIAYAVMSFGGILGMGNSYHPLPLEHVEVRHAPGRLCGRVDQGAT